MGDRGCAGSGSDSYGGNTSGPAESGTWIAAGNPERWPGALLDRLLEAGGAYGIEGGRLLIRMPPGPVDDLRRELERRLAEAGR